MACTMDRIGAIGELSLATGSDLRPIYAYIDRDPDTCSSHTHGNANTNSYSHTFIDADPGTAWLS
jgi:hypothetical protein